jgi:hypothetical protein
MTVRVAVLKGREPYGGLSRYDNNIIKRGINPNPPKA